MHYLCLDIFSWIVATDPGDITHGSLGVFQTLTSVGDICAADSV